MTARLRQGYEIGPARLLVRFVLITFLYGAGSKKYHELNPCIELALTVFSSSVTFFIICLFDDVVLLEVTWRQKFNLMNHLQLVGEIV